MHEQPEQPAEVPGHVHEAEVGNRRVAADGRHVAGIDVTERGGLFAGNRAGHIRGRMAPCLLCDLRDTGQRFSGLMRERREIAGNEDAGMTGHGEIRFDDHASGPIEARPEIAAERRSSDAGGPQDRVRLDALIANPHRALLNPGDGLADAYVDAKPQQRSPGRLPKVVGK